MGLISRLAQSLIDMFYSGWYLSPSLPGSQTLPPLLCSVGLDTAHVQHRLIQKLLLS